MPPSRAHDRATDRIELVRPTRVEVPLQRAAHADRQRRQAFENRFGLHGRAVGLRNDRHLPRAGDQSHHSGRDRTSPIESPAAAVVSASGASIASLAHRSVTSSSSTAQSSPAARSAAASASTRSASSPPPPTQAKVGERR